MKQVPCFSLVVFMAMTSNPNLDVAQQTANSAITNPVKTSVSLPEYDIATIKPAVSGDGKLDIWTGDNTWRASNISTLSLLSAAFGINENLISGLPAWAKGARYDISAKTSDPVPNQSELTRSDRLHMLQSLLAERFTMQTHTELREETVFELVQRQSTRSAPGLRPSNENSAAGLDAARGQQRRGTHLLAHRDAEIAALADELSVYLLHPVIDATGLKGKYDIDLSWLRENAPVSAATDIPSDIFTAVREQLGLELRNTRTKVPVLIIDRWSQPTPN